MAPPPEGSTPVHTMKRTGRSPWSTLTRGTSAMSVAQVPGKAQTSTRARSPGPPARAASRDVRVPPVTAVPPPAAPRSTMAASSKISALQREWEAATQKTGQAHGMADGSQPTAGDGSADPPSSDEAAAEKEPQVPPGASSSGRESTDSLGAASVAQGSSTLSRDAAVADAVAQAQRLAEAQTRRFSEGAAGLRQMKQVATPTTKTADKIYVKKVQAVQPQRSQDRPLGPFLTPSELLETKRGEVRKRMPSASGNSAADGQADNSTLEASQLGSSSRITHPMLDKDANGQSYYLYMETDGSLQSTKGAPFPRGYERSDLPEQPFICPVRDCRVLFPDMKRMASHFHGRHSAKLFNDNGDGTFSELGKYVNKEGTSPGIIVSQSQLPPRAPQPATPSWAGSFKRLLEVNEQSPQPSGLSPPAAPELQKRLADTDSSAAEVRTSKRLRTTPVLAPSVTPIYPPLTTQGGKMPTTELLRYLHAFLHPKQKVPDQEDIRALARYKRARELPTAWVSFHKNKTLDPLHYACALAYLVGDEVTGPAICKKRLGSKSSPLSLPCIALPSTLPAAARAYFSKSPTCVACQYHYVCYRQNNQCEWNGQKQPSVESPEAEEPSPEAKHDGVKPAAQWEGHPSEPEHGHGHGHESEPGSESGSEPEPEPAPKENRPKLLPSRERRRLRQLRAPKGATAYGLAPPALSAVSQLSIADLEMEDWEFAPGTMKDEPSNENLGFSNAYLTSGRPVAVSPDVGFNIVTLKSGAHHHWATQGNKIRTCSVGSGKVRVKAGAKTFNLGTNGMFVIRPGQSCTVENRLYMDSVIHCTTIQDYELLSEEGEGC